LGDTVAKRKVASANPFAVGRKEAMEQLTERGRRNSSISVHFTGLPEVANGAVLNRPKIRLSAIHKDSPQEGRSVIKWSKCYQRAVTVINPLH